MILDAEAEISSFNDTDFQAGSNSLIFTWLALAWVAWLGWFASTVYILAQTELLATTIPSFPVIDRAGLYGSLLWLVWMLVVGVYLIKYKANSVQSSYGEKMKAIVYTKYGPPDVLQLMEVAKPEPKEDQVLVKVRAASANAFDYRRFEKLSTMGRLMEEQFIKPIGKALGADISGVVEAVGANVKQFQPGDEVFGVVAGSRGGFAEYACAAEGHLALKPTNLSFEAAAAVPVAALTALQGLRDKGQIQPGQKVLINGASGGVGTFALQIAKVFSAEVTAVCSKRNLNMTLSIGADHVIDYTKEDFTKKGFACYSRITRNR